MPGFGFSFGMDAGGGGGGVGPPVPLLSLDFTSSLPSGLTFTRASNGSRVNVSGVVVHETTNAPRFDYAPISHAPLGMLIEQAATNLVTNSEAMSNASWTKTGTTVTADATTAPDGTMTADKLVETAANSVHSTTAASIAYVTGNNYTASFWAKAAERSFVQFAFGSTPFGLNCFATFDLAGGVVSFTGSTATATITAYPDGWYLCRVSGACISSLTSAFVIATVATGPGSARNAAFVGTLGAGVYLWGAQVEQTFGTYRSSYIPTAASAVTRALDLAIMDGANFTSWYSTTRRIVVVAQPDTSTIGPLWQADDGTSPNRMVIYTSGTGVYALVRNGGVDQAFLSLGTITPGDVITVSFSFANGMFSASLNGGAPVVQASGTVPTVDRCRFGSDHAGLGLNGHMKGFQAYAS